MNGPACGLETTHLFDSKNSLERAQAKWLCRGCPIREACLDEALSRLNTVDGVRCIQGGADPRAMRGLGTPGAKRVHFDRLDKMEKPERMTHAEVSRQYRARKRIRELVSA